MTKNQLLIKIGRKLEDEFIDLHKRPGLLEDKDYPQHIIYFKSFGQFVSVFTQKKMELLQYIINNEGLTVTEIAAKLERKKEAISRDLHQLENEGLIELKQEGRITRPAPKFDTLVMPMKANAKRIVHND